MPPRIRRFGDDEQYRPLFEELAQRYEPVRSDPRFLAELELALLGLPMRRPTPLQHARQLSEHLHGAQIYIKREDFAGKARISRLPWPARPCWRCGWAAERWSPALPTAGAA